MIWLDLAWFMASSLFLVRSSWEMFVLTPRHWPQMIFFSLLHTWPEAAVMSFIASWFTYYAFVAFAILLAIVRVVATEAGVHGPWSSRVIARLAGPRGRMRSVIIYALAVLAAVHFAVAMTYEHWAAALFGPSV